MPVIVFSGRIELGQLFAAARGEIFVQGADEVAQFLFFRGQGHRNVDQGEKRLGLHKAVFHKKAVRHAFVDEGVDFAGFEHACGLCKVIHKNELKRLGVNFPE